MLKVYPAEFSGREGQVCNLSLLLRSFKQTELSCKALHLVSAWAAENRLVLAQVAVDEKSNEITAIPLLLRQLALSGCIVTSDAMGTQIEMAKPIVDDDADSVLALKGTHGTLAKEVQETFDRAQADQFTQIPHQFSQRVDKGHERLEIRKQWIIDDPESIAY